MVRQEGAANWSIVYIDATAGESSELAVFMALLSNLEAVAEGDHHVTELSSGRMYY